MNNNYNKLLVKGPEKLLVEHELFNTPVKVEKLAKKLNIKIALQDLEDDLSGFLVRKKGEDIIGVNKNHPPVRQRFTISHEIAHHQCHANQPLFVDYYKGKIFRRSENSKNYKIEREANIYAANLLMPEQLISKEIKKLKNNLNFDELVEALGEVFQVSKQAMDFRLKYLGYYDYGF